MSVPHISIVLTIRVPKISKFGVDLTKFWQKQVGTFFGPPCTRVIPKVSDFNILDNNIFYNLYISETYILYEL